MGKMRPASGSATNQSRGKISMTFKRQFSLVTTALAGAFLVSCASGNGSERAGDGPRVIGEEVTTSLSSPGYVAPEEGRSAEMVWQEEIFDGKATYIAIHFAEFELPEGAELIVRTPDYSRRATYALRGKDIIGGNGFWALHMPGERAVIELSSSVSLAAGAVTIDRFARGLPAYDELGGEISENLVGGGVDTEAICGADDSREAKCYQTSEPNAYGEGRAVARLVMNGTGGCTGWLVGSEGHVMTNEHCIGNQSTASNTDFEFMAEGATCATDCRSSGACAGDVVATSSTVVKINASLDYTLVQLPTNPTATYGYMQLRDGLAVVGERIYIPQHPARWGKRIAMYLDSSETSPAVVSSITEPACTGGAPVDDVGYFADTQGGSSGSPVLGYSDNLVVALHHCANCPNRGVPIKSIIDDLNATGDLPANAIGGGGGGDTEPPTVSVTNPADGSTVSGTVTIEADASDNVGVTSVEFFVDGVSQGTDTTAPYSVTWNTLASGNGSHSVSATARDAAGNSDSDSVNVTVDNGAGNGQAVYDPGLGTAVCADAGSSCDSGTLFDGRGTISGGAEPNASNTLDGCADGNSGSYHNDESSDRVLVYTTSGNDFAGGETVTVEATVWAWSTGTSDNLDVFYATDANNPSWTLINTIPAGGSGERTLSTSFALENGASLQAVRVQWRYNSTTDACSSGSYNDRDDLVINVAGGGGPGPGDGLASFDPGLGIPVCTGAAGSCDSQTLLDGRGTVSGGAESNAPNAMGGCTDGNSGTYHSDESVDAILVTSSSGNLSAGTSIDIDVTAYWWSTTSDSLDVYYTEDVNNPSWTAIATDLKASATGLQTLTVSHTPSSSGNHAVRAQLRYQGSASSCTSGNYNDHDDLGFEVQ